MLRLRPYKKTDGTTLASWVRDARTVDMWKPRRFTYPLTADQLERYYEDFARDGNAWIFTALDEEGKMAGHFCMRLADYGKNSVRLGYIIVDPEIKGKGYGRQMLSQALCYAFQILGMQTVTLGVYSDNAAARRCYESLGFKETGRTPEDGREYIEMEAREG